MDFLDMKNAQKEAVSMLVNSYHRDRLSHAYIFEGEAGGMKFDTALFFAALLLCESEDKRPCGVCSACRRIDRTTHPNVHIVRPTREQILKESIKELQSDFSKTSLEDGPKIYIIEKADTLNPQASNALLKFLEEPEGEMYAVLLVEDEQNLLPTIRSRSQVVPFHPPAKAVIEKKLLGEGFDAPLAKLAARMYPTVTEARDFLEDENTMVVVDAVSDLYEALAKDESPLIAFRREADSLLSSRESAAILLDVFIHYQKDLIYGKIENRNQIAFVDRIDTIEALAERFSLSGLLDVLERMLTFRMRFRSFVNVRLAFDNIMLALGRGLEHGE